MSLRSKLTLSCCLGLLAGLAGGACSPLVDLLNGLLDRALAAP